MAWLLLLMACGAAPLVGPPVPPDPTVPATPIAAPSEPTVAAPSEPTVAAPSEPTVVAETAPLPAPTVAILEATFDGARALALVADQLAFGARHPGTPGHAALRDWIVTELEARDVMVERQPFVYRDVPVENIIGRANIGAGPIVILGAHFDTRRVADVSGVDAPVPGANDGGSGVAVLLEMATVLDYDRVPYEIWYAFFDAEDNGGGGIAGWDWIAGSRYMAANLPPPIDQYEAMILFDMVGDADQQFYYEGNSTPALQADLWAEAAALGFDAYFIPEMRYTMIDDHVPFREAGIDAVDIIDFDYPYWHTVDDTLDKVSADSLFRAGRTVESWLESPP